jgi:gas vesicle protein
MGTKQNVMTPETITRDEDTRSSAEIESDIRETRHRMDATLDQLGNRLTPRSLINSALDWWESPEPGSQGSVAAKKAVVTVARQARRHPMPALLIGSGIAWLVSETMSHEDEEIEMDEGTRSRRIRHAGRRDGGRRGKIEEAKDAATGAIETVKEKASAVKEKASELTEKVHETTDRLSEQAHEAMERGKSTALTVKTGLKDTYQVGTEKFSRACEEYPLAVGLSFAALGALVGLVIPRTHKEDELMGEQSDQIIQEAKEKGGELLETGKVVGERVLDAVKEGAREQGLTGGNVAETISGLADKGGQIAQKAKEEVIHAAEEQGLKPPAAPQGGEKEPIEVGSCNC